MTRQGRASVSPIALSAGELGRRRGIRSQNPPREASPHHQMNELSRCSRRSHKKRQNNLTTPLQLFTFRRVRLLPASATILSWRLFERRHPEQGWPGVCGLATSYNISWPRLLAAACFGWLRASSLYSHRGRAQPKVSPPKRLAQAIQGVTLV